jgi:SAM-dependent methyltransferase
MTSYDAKFYRGQRGLSYRSANAVVPLLFDLMDLRSVCDVGCGIGTWLRAFLDHGVTDVLGLDGDWVDPRLLQVPAAHFLKADLMGRLSLGRKFDLALSVEVAEHLSESRAISFVEDLTRLAPVVLFSAAIPGQGGTDHVNEQWQTWWQSLFVRNGYTLCDALRPRIWYNARIAPWYRQNIVVFCRSECLPGYPKLAEADHTLRLPLVHPEQLTLHDSLRALWRAVRRSVALRMPRPVQGML